MRENLRTIGDAVRRHSIEGRTETIVPRLTLHRTSKPAGPAQVIHPPSLCVALQGQKRAIVGGNVLSYGADAYLVVSVEMPLFSEVVAADVDCPYLGMALELDTALLSALLAQMGGATIDAGPAPELRQNSLDPDLLQPLHRLVGLLDRPADLPFLGPSIERELLFRLLQGPQAAALRHVVNRESRMSRIAGAATLIRERYAEPIRIEALARSAGMSPSTFHQHFKKMNAVSPLQYQKLVRLYEARRMLISGSRDIAKVGFSVGYDSPSQFSREYRRLFGASPRQDSDNLRSSLS